MSRTPKPFSRRAFRQHQEMERSGCCGRGFWCLGSFSRKHRKRIVPATRLHDGSTQSSHAWGANGAPPSGAEDQFVFLFPALLAPPSSPASYQNSVVPSSVQSPAAYASLNPPCSTSSTIPLETNSNMFATGPYAHETALVSPPVFSTFTTAPSTAPFTPPPELAAHLTTPSSPDVPFAQLLASSFSEKRSSTRQPDAPYSASPFASPDYYVQQDDLQAAYQLYPGSPLAHLISPAGGTGASTPFAAGGTGTSTPLAAGAGTGASTPYPEADNPIPLTVLPAVVSSLEVPYTIEFEPLAFGNLAMVPSKELKSPRSMHKPKQMDPKHLAESLQQQGLLDIQRIGDDRKVESDRQSDANCMMEGMLSCTGSSNRLGGVLDMGAGHFKGLTENATSADRLPWPTGDSSGEEKANCRQLGQDAVGEEDLLELPVLAGFKLVHHHEDSVMDPSLTNIDSKQRNAAETGLKVYQIKEIPSSKILGSFKELPEGAALDLGCRSEDNVLEYELSSNAGVGGATLGWGPVNSSLSQELVSQSSNGPDKKNDSRAFGSMETSMSNAVPSEGVECINTDEGRKCLLVEARGLPSEEGLDHPDGFPGCCPQCEELTSRCQTLSLALKQAEEKDAENQRVANDREHKLKQLLQQMQMGDSGDLRGFDRQV